MNQNNSKFFEGNSYFVDEKVGFLKFCNEYKVYNENAEQIGMVKQRLSTGSKFLRFFAGNIKSLMPFTLEIVDNEERVQARIRKGWSFFLSKITVTDADGIEIATVQQKFKFMKPKFLILDTNQSLIATILGDWKAWNFSIVGANEQEIGTISKKWAGIAKEFFTTADKYNVSLKPVYQNDLKKKIALLSTAITIDMVLKESK